MPTPTSFFVYVNWRGRGYSCRIHFSWCRYCHDGHGINPRANNRTGRWFGPFNSYERAFAAAQQLARYRARCRHCQPR